MPERADEPADGESAGGVLVDVERRRRVGDGPSLLDPASSGGRRRRDRVARALARTQDRRRGPGPASRPGRAAARGASRRTAARPRRSPSEHRRGTLVTVRRGVEHARGVDELRSWRRTTWSCSTWTAWSTSEATRSTAWPSRIERVREPGATSRSSPTTPRGRPDQVAEKLVGGRGRRATAADVVTSAQAAARRAGRGARRGAQDPAARAVRDCGSRCVEAGLEPVDDPDGRGRRGERLRPRRALARHHAGLDAGARRTALRRQQHRHDHPDALRPRARARRAGADDLGFAGVEPDGGGQAGEAADGGDRAAGRR